MMLFIVSLFYKDLQCVFIIKISYQKSVTNMLLLKLSNFMTKMSLLLSIYQVRQLGNISMCQREVCSPFLWMGTLENLLREGFKYWVK